MNERKMKQEEVNVILETLDERFGLKPKLFESYDFFVNDKNNIFILNKTASMLVESYGKKIAGVGMFFARMDEVLKPTNHMLQVFGKSARKNVIELNRAKTHVYIEGFELETYGISADDGYVILRYDDKILGCGFLNDFRLKNIIPESRKTRLKYL